MALWTATWWLLTSLARVRLSLSCVANVCDSPAKAVEKLILEHIQPVCREDPNEFRSKYLYTEEVSDIFSEHIVMVHSLMRLARQCSDCRLLPIALDRLRIHPLTRPRTRVCV